MEKKIDSRRLEISPNQTLLSVPNQLFGLSEDLTGAIESWELSLKVSVKRMMSFSQSLSSSSDSLSLYLCFLFIFVFQISPDSPDAHTNLASAYVLAKPSRPDLAVKHLK